MNEKEKQITEVKIFITNGKIEIFEDELKTSFLKEIFKDTIEIDRKRVSYIYPQNFMLRQVFLIIRRIFKNNEKIIEWTRNWKCLWQVEILDGKEKTVFKGFQNRKDAVKFEKDYILRKKINIRR
jgi:hypothetical protein